MYDLLRQHQGEDEYQRKLTERTRVKELENTEMLVALLWSVYFKDGMLLNFLEKDDETSDEKDFLDLILERTRDNSSYWMKSTIVSKSSRPDVLTY